MIPVVRYMLLCDDVRVDPNRPQCAHIDCLMTHIVSLDDPPFPLLRDKLSVYLVLTECYGSGIAQIRVAFVDDEFEQPLFGSAVHRLDFTARSPLAALGFSFRIEACTFPKPGQYSVQFWYNGAKIEERPLALIGGHQ